MAVDRAALQTIFQNDFKSLEILRPRPFGDSRISLRSKNHITNLVQPQYETRSNGILIGTGQERPPEAVTQAAVCASFAAELARSMPNAPTVIEVTCSNANDPYFRQPREFVQKDLTSALIHQLIRYTPATCGALDPRSLMSVAGGSGDFEEKLMIISALITYAGRQNPVILVIGNVETLVAEIETRSDFERLIEKLEGLAANGLKLKILLTCGGPPSLQDGRRFLMLYPWLIAADVADQVARV
jgi:hypothetical protein